MDVDARVGSYKLDSSNFVSDEGFRGFIGPTGEVGVDRDYDSLRQDLWIATDQAFKEAVETYSRKQAYLSSLARQSDIDDFAKGEPVQLVEALETPDWTSRNWDQEARAAAPMLAQVLGPAVNGARPPISFSPVMEQMLGNLGGKSDWVGRLGARVLPAGVSLVDDPSARDFRGTPLIGSYAVDNEGVRAQKVTLVDSGNLKNELMSRRPGPDFNESNGHGRAAFLNDAKPTMSNLFFSSAQTLSAADLKKKFLDSCRAEKLNYCLVVREMDNPVLSLLHQEDFSELLASYGGGAGNGDRLPLVVYRVYPETGREEMIRGSRIIGLNTRALRNLAGIGNDNFVYNYMQSQNNGFAGTALGAFGSAQVGLPAAVVAPSLLFDELEMRGARGEAKRLPLLPPPPMSPAK